MQLLGEAREGGRMSYQQQLVTLQVPVFIIGTDKEGAGKVLEEAAEAYGSWQMYAEARGTFNCTDITGQNPFKVMFAKEVFDCIQACVNLAMCYGLDMDDAAIKVTSDNVARGRLPMGVKPSATLQYYENVGDDVERIRFRGGKVYVRDDIAETNYDRWLGTPEKAAWAISCVVDYMENLLKDGRDSEGITYHSDFTDTLHDESPYALIHSDTLLGWLHQRPGDEHA